MSADGITKIPLAKAKLIFIIQATLYMKLTYQLMIIFSPSFSFENYYLLITTIYTGPTMMMTIWVGKVFITGKGDRAKY